MHIIGIFNRDGGTFRTTDMDALARRAIEIFAEHGHVLDPRIVAGADLEEALGRAATEAEVLMAGGGDGTISAAAAVAYRQHIPLAVLPAGTMNLFARSLRIPLELEAALAALANGEVAEVDIATANGRPFVHQFSVGIHPKLVKLREALTYRSRIGKMIASTRAAAAAALKPPNFWAELRSGGHVERRRTAGISISNDPFTVGPIPRADVLDAGVLGIYVVAPLTTWTLLKLCLAVLRGRWKGASEVVEREAKQVTIRFPRRKSGALAVIDGELIRLAERIDLEIHPGALQVVMPRPAEHPQAEVTEPLLASA